MKIVLGVFIITLAVLGFIPNSFAFWPFDSPVQESNVITIRQQDSIINYDKVTHQGSWQSAPPWLYDYTDFQGNAVYSPYKIWDSSDFVTFENAQASITVEKGSCSLRIFDGGRVQSNSNALLNSVSFDLQYAINGTDTWNESPENSDTCNVQYQKSPNGLTANLIQGSTIQKNIELQLYDNKIPELILKVTNNNYSNTNTKYGFALSITNSSNTIIDGDLIRFQDSKNNIVLIFDTQNSINHYLWTIKKTESGLVLDYKNSKGPLAPGETLIIDPTFSQTATTFPIETTNGVDNSACANTAVAPSTGDQSQGFSSASGLGCSAVIQKFDITSFPKTSIVSSVQIKEDVSASALTGNFNGTCTIRQVLNDPSGMSNTQKLKNATLTNEYLHSFWCGTSASNVKVNLGTTALSDFKNQIASGFFAVGLQKQSWDQSNSVAGATGAVFSNPTLQVNYTLPVPNAVTNVSCSPTQALGNTCTWNNATSTGGKVQGFYVTRNGTSEPLFSSNLVRYLKFDGLTLSNTIEDYSSNKLNGTISSGSFNNQTGMIAQAMNFSGSQYVSTSSTNLPFRSSDRSIAFWVHTPASFTATTALFSYGAASANNETQLAFADSGATSRLNFPNPFVANHNSVTSLTVNTWYHIVATISGTKIKNLYINSVLDGGFPVTDNVQNTTTSSLYIGSNLGAGGTLTGKTYIDDFRVYNKALSQSEITTLYNYRLNSAVSKLDSYLTRDGQNYQYCVYPVNQYGQNDTGTCANTVTANYATPPSTTGGKFYQSGTYDVQFGWNPLPKIGSDNYQATGYQIQRWNGASFTTILSNTTSKQYTDTSLVNAASQKYKIQSYNHLGLSPGFTFINTNTTGLIDLYQFDNNTKDSGTKTNTPTITGLENYTVGNIGYALALDGNTSLKYTATGVPNGTSDRTVSMWIKKSSFTNNLNGFFSQGGTAANSFFGLLDANGKIECGGPSNNVNSSTTLSANKWELISCVLSNSGKTKQIYINGTLDASATTGTGISSTASNVYIGTRVDNTNKNVTGFIDNFRIYNTALNSTFMTELYNQQIRTQDNKTVSGTHTVTFTTVGDITRATSQLTLTGGGFPTSLTVQNWHLYNYSGVYNNTNVSTPATIGVPLTFLYGNYFNIDVNHNFKAVARVSNGTGTTLINSTVYPVLYNYLPHYTTTSGVMWNYTMTRPSPSTNLTLLANENPILFNMKCQIQTASDAAAGKSNGWYNVTNAGYFLQSLTVHNYDNVYGTCYTSSLVKLFTFISYGNSSLFPAITFMNQSYGAYVGVPVGVVFIVMAAALGNRRTAPMWVVIILAMAGIMSAVSFFTLNAGVWALALIAGLLALFVGRKIF